MLPVLLEACTPDAEPPPPRTWEDYDVLQYVDPRIGTGGEGAQTTGVGPHAAWPLGETLVGPDTRSSSTGVLPFYHYGGYHWDDDRIDSFSHTHAHGMGVVDFGAVSVMPRASWDPTFTTGPGRAAPFSHDAEEAGPGRYAVDLQDDGTHVEIVATRHGAHHRYTFAGGSSPVVVVDLGHALPTTTIGDDAWIEVGTDGEIRGFQRVLGGYSGRFGGVATSFVGRVDPAPTSFGSWSDPLAPVADQSSASGATCGAWLAFASGTTTVDLRIALSVVDEDGARANLAAELPDTDLEARLDAVRAAWADELGHARIWGGADEHRARRIFHTAEYHSLLMPRTYRDVDGRYRGVDGQIHTADFDYLSDLSLWDTFRTLHPWWLLVHPDHQLDVARSLVRMEQDGGSLPRWPLAHGYTGGMIGSPASIVLADTWMDGLRDGWDADEALTASIAQSDGPTSPVGRDHVEDWTGLGWVPSDVGGSVSETLEYAWADHAIAAWADAMGRPDDAARLAHRADQWSNVWDPAVGFHHARRRDGTFEAFTSDLAWTDDYTEGNAWHYLWTVPWDVQGLVAVQHGGDADAFADRYAAYWDDVRAEPDDQLPDDWYWHGNEPVLHYAWLGSLAGRPDLTVAAAHWVLGHRYADDELGLDGNDDAGTLSAWYLWSALGLYPIAATRTVAVGAPIVEHAELDTRLGHLVVDAPGARGDGLAPTRVLLNGEPLAGAVLDSGDLEGELEFELP